MNNINTDHIIATIEQHEKLKMLSKIKRLCLHPFKTLPYYILACMAKIKPFTISFKTLWGDTLTCDLPNGNTFYYFGYPEANLTNYMLKNIKPGHVCIDGGANVGFYSMLLARLVEPHGRVYSFEPTPSTFKLLNINTQQYNNVTIINKALSNDNAPIHFIDYGLGYNSFNSIYYRKNIKALNKKGTRIRIETCTLDTFCEHNNIKPNFLKLDLEGSEYYALEGAVTTIKKYRPDISLEVAGDSEWIDNINKCDRLLRSLGYVPFSIKNDGTLHTHSLQNNYHYDNLIYKYSQ